MSLFLSSFFITSKISYSWMFMFYEDCCCCCLVLAPLASGRFLANLIRELFICEDEGSTTTLRFRLLCMMSFFEVFILTADCLRLLEWMDGG